MLKNIFWISFFSVLFFVLSYVLTKENHTFPKLENTNYIGKAFIYKKSYPLFVKKGKILALVKKGVRPKLIEKRAVIYINDKEYILTGEEKKGRLLGHIKLNHQKIGTWYLEEKKLEKQARKKILKKTIKKENIKNNKKIQLQVELAKNYHLSRDLKTELKEKLKKINYNNKLINKILNKEITPSPSSKDSSKNFSKGKLGIEKEFKEIEEKNKKLLGKIQKRYAQLSQVNRISKKGRLLEFNKRTSKRENSWYLINWGQFNNYDYEIEAAKKLGISRNTLRKKLNLAQKYIDTKTAIRKEKDLIDNLRSSLDYPREIKTRVERIETNRGEKRGGRGKKKKSFWKKVGDIFR